jgi:polyadenylate-binding protein
MADNFQAQNFLNASLYVGDLDRDVTEAQLFEKFSVCGTIVLAKICRDKITRQSLGYAYVNFSQPADAERALDTFNFDLLNHRPMRIMWSNRDPALRRSGVGNVFIKNLDKSIDNKSLYDTFSTFGNIISCKIMSDENGSKGYGFVHFETEEAAEKAIKSVNNMLLNGKIVYVGTFLPKHNRGLNEGEASKVFTNIYVKNFQDTLDEESLKTLFAKFGEITSVKISVDNNTSKPCGFGFVNFKEPEDASNAVQALNETVVNDRKLFVGRFQKKSERLADLKRKFEEQKLERLRKYHGVNLFVKNLDDKIDDERLRKEFSAYGEITSAKVMQENGRSKGFGFVCFSAPEEATKAIADLNGRILSTKPLYVALAQRKDERSSILASQFKERLHNTTYYNQAMFQQQNQNVYYAYQNAVANQASPRFVSAAAAPTIEDYQQLMNNQPMMRAQSSVPRWQLPGNSRPNNAMITGDNVYSQYVQGQQFNANVGMQQLQQQQQQQQQQSRNYRPQFNNNNMMPQQNFRNPMPFAVNNSAVNYQKKFPNQQQQQQQFNTIPTSIRNPSPRFKQNTQLQQGQVQVQIPPQVVNIPGQEPLTIAELSAADPKQQKQMLGERLFPLIQALNGSLAGKITGMLLEIDNAELLHMLDSSESLKAKVDEAMSVLQSHHEKQLQQQLQ